MARKVKTCYCHLMTGKQLMLKVKSRRIIQTTQLKDKRQVNRSLHLTLTTMRQINSDKQLRSQSNPS